MDTAGMAFVREDQGLTMSDTAKWDLTPKAKSISNAGSNSVQACLRKGKKTLHSTCEREE